MKRMTGNYVEYDFFFFGISFIFHCWLIWFFVPLINFLLIFISPQHRQSLNCFHQHAYQVYLKNKKERRKNKQKRSVLRLIKERESGIKRRRWPEESCKNRTIEDHQRFFSLSQLFCIFFSMCYNTEILIVNPLFNDF